MDVGVRGDVHAGERGQRRQSMAASSLVSSGGDVMEQFRGDHFGFLLERIEDQAEQNAEDGHPENEVGGEEDEQTVVEPPSARDGIPEEVERHGEQPAAEGVDAFEQGVIGIDRQAEADARHGGEEDVGVGGHHSGEGRG